MQARSHVLAKIVCKVSKSEAANCHRKKNFKKIIKGIALNKNSDYICNRF